MRARGQSVRVISMGKFLDHEGRRDWGEGKCVIRMRRDSLFLLCAGKKSPLVGLHFPAGASPPLSPVKIKAEASEKERVRGSRASLMSLSRIKCTGVSRYPFNFIVYAKVSVSCYFNVNSTVQPCVTCTRRELESGAKILDLVS